MGLTGIQIRDDHNQADYNFANLVQADHNRADPEEDDQTQAGCNQVDQVLPAGRTLVDPRQLSLPSSTLPRTRGRALDAPHLSRVTSLESRFPFHL